MSMKFETFEQITEIYEVRIVSYDEYKRLPEDVKKNSFRILLKPKKC